MAYLSDVTGLLVNIYNVAGGVPGEVDTEMEKVCRILAREGFVDWHQ